jgi:rod shape-determining protein MreC
MFPRACAETRVGVGALLPATAPLTAAQPNDAEAALRERIAKLADENARLVEEREALPAAGEGPLAGARVVRPAARPPVLVQARVLHRDASATRRSFSIDAGRADGVTAGMPVACGDSMVGVVSAVTEHSALVIRIDDPTAASAVAATVLTADPARRPAGVARGTGDGDTAVSFLKPGDAQAGDLVVTGVGDPLVPEGLVLGEVVGFGDDDRDGSWEAEVRPLRDLDTLKSVVVVRVATGGGPSLAAGRLR